MNLESQKEAFMLSIRKLLAAKDETLRLARRYPMCQTQVIERYGRNVKDPNPLQSMMATISTKYPISIDREKARQYNIPKELCPLINDTHRFQRVLAKKETIDWWITNSPLPDNHLTQLIDLLYRYPREEVKRYFNQKFEEKRLKFGPVNLEKRRVSTSVPILNVPYHIRNDVIIHAMMPDFAVPNENVPFYYVEKLKEFFGDLIINEMPLRDQLRIVTRALENRAMVIPVLPGTQEAGASLRHCICQNMWALSNTVVVGENSNENISKEIEQFSEILCKMMLDLRPYSEIKYLMYNTKISKRQVNEIIRDEKIEDSPFLRIIRAQEGMPISMESRRHDIHFFPEVSTVLVSTMTTAGGLQYKTYMGQEIIHFKRGDMRGQFVHDGDHIYRITTNFTTLRDLNRTLGLIAQYCKVGLSNSIDKSITMAYDRIAAKFTREPWLLINANPKLYAGIAYDKLPLTIGILRINKASEILPITKIKCRVTSKLEIIAPSQQVIEAPIPRHNLTLSSNVEAPRIESLMDFQPPKIKLREKMEYYLRHEHILRDKISRQIFDWKNGSITSLIPPYMREPVSSNSRMILTRVNADPKLFDIHYVSFLYCFCETPGVDVSVADNSKKFLCGGMNMSILADEGAFKYDDASRRYLFCGTPISAVQERPKIHKLIEGILKGYRFEVYKIGERLESKTLTDLSANADKIPEGSRYLTYYCGLLLIAIRDSFVALNTYRTIQRQIRQRETNKTLEFEAEHILFARRKQQEPDDTTPSIDLNEPSCSWHS